MLYHIISDAEWLRLADPYAPASLTDEGFIHLSTREQLLETAERYYASAGPLRVLVVDPDAAAAEIRWERSPLVDELFPHLYGSLERRAIVGAPKLLRSNGRFCMPSLVADQPKLVRTQRPQ